MVVTDEKRFQSLRAELAAARVYLTQSAGGIPGTLEHAQRALELTPPGDEIGRASGTALVALALWGRGDLHAAHRTFSEALAIMKSCGHELDAVRGVFVLGDIRVAQGRLRDAASIYEQGLRLANSGTFSAPPETDELNLGLSELHLEWNDISGAIGFLDTIEASRPKTSHIGNRQRWCTAMANVRVAQGNLDGALAFLDEAESHERRDPIPRVRPIPAIKARIRIAQGRLDDAGAWATQANVSVDGELSYLREFEHITLARMLIARSSSSGDQRSLHDAARLLERLHIAAQTGGRIGSVIEISVLEAVTQHALGNLRGALDALGAALGLAEPDGYLRTFLDQGIRVRDLLRHSIARGLSHAYARTVLAAFDGPRQPVAPVAPATTNGASDAAELTTRELEILH
jgi:LuxR family maltose regulon positive regulatory protein